MPWPDLKMEIEKTDPIGRSRPEDDPNFDQGLHKFFSEAIALHTDNAAFKTPDFAVLNADDDKNVFVYSRGTGDELRVVALNRSNTEQTVQIGVPVTKVVFVSQEEPAAAVLQGGQLKLPPLTGVVLQ